MRKGNETTKVTALLDVSEQAASVLRDMYTLKLLTPEDVETDFTVDERGKKKLAVRMVEAKEKIEICSKMVSGLLERGVTVFQWGGPTGDGKQWNLCEFYYE